MPRAFRAILLATAFLAFQPKVGAVLRAPESEQALVEQISAKFGAGEIDAALQRARAAVAQYPRSATLHQLLGAALFKKGLNAEARAAFRRAIELDPSVAQNHFNLALVDLSESKYSEAAKSLEAFLRLEPANAQARVLLGRAYHNLNRTLPAIEQFKKALELAPQLPLVHYHLGYAYQSQGNLKAALEEFKREIQSNPAFYEPYWLAGNIELGQGDLDAAEDSFRKGSELRPQAYQGHYGLARVLIARKQFQEAEIELKKAVELSPSGVEVHYALARAYQQMGKKEDAAREYKVVAALAFRAGAGAPQRRGTPHLTAPQGSTLADQFVEVSVKAGIHFTLTSGGPEKRYIIEAKGGGGIARIDYDNDGYPDLFLVNGSTFAHWRRGDSPQSRLYRNNGDGTFTDVAYSAGIGEVSWLLTTFGAKFLDYDNVGGSIFSSLMARPSLKWIGIQPGSLMPSATCCSTTAATGNSRRLACALGWVWQSRR